MSFDREEGLASGLVNGLTGNRLVRPPLPRLRLMEVGEVLDEAFDLYKKNFRLFFGLAVLLNTFSAVIVLATPEQGAARLVANLFSFLTTLITAGALTDAALARIMGRQTTLGAAYRQGLRNSMRLLLGAIVYGLAMAGGLILFLVPGFFVILWALLLPPVVVVEKRTGIAALTRARQLAAGNVWRLFFLGLGLFLVSMVLGMVLVTLLGMVYGFTGTSPDAPLGPSDTRTMLLRAAVILVASFMQAGWTPVFLTAQLLTYLDLRVRREAYDLELLTAAVEARAAVIRTLASPDARGPAGP